ncbi:hypothetical protein L7F22_050740 [Adiantum nelumboides]|nr:hypothetical protein [Adiantum nelumboides]
MESLTPVVNYILEGEFPKEFTTGQRRKLIKQASTFLWLEGSLYQKGKDLVCRRVPSTNEIPKILKGLHEEACGGHFSHELTLKKVLLAGYVWPSMHADVQHWCRSYHNCQVNGNKKLLYGPRQAIIANGPFEKWGIDAMGPLPRTANGKLYILVAIDYMTRWVEAQSVAKVNEKTVSKFVYTHICCRFGTPLEIVFDNGPRFRRGLLTEVCEELKISHRHSTPYYPQSNGLVEKANGIIAGIIRKMVESKPKRWDNFLDGAIWAYRTTYRDATQFTPFHLVYGQEALQPIELNIPTIKLTGGYYQLMDLNGKEHPRKVNGYRLKPYLSRILPAVFITKQVSKKTKKEFQLSSSGVSYKRLPMGSHMELDKDSDSSSCKDIISGSSTQEDHIADSFLSPEQHVLSFEKASLATQVGTSSNSLEPEVNYLIKEEDDKSGIVRELFPHGSKRKGEDLLSKKQAVIPFKGSLSTYTPTVFSISQFSDCKVRFALELHVLNRYGTFKTTRDFKKYLKNDLVDQESLQTITLVVKEPFIKQ